MPRSPGRCRACRGSRRWRGRPAWPRACRLGTPQHGLSSNKMALITSDCGTTRSLGIKRPVHPGLWCLFRSRRCSTSRARRTLRPCRPAPPPSASPCCCRWERAACALTHPTACCSALNTHPAARPQPVLRCPARAAQPVCADPRAAPVASALQCFKRDPKERPNATRLLQVSPCSK